MKKTLDLPLIAEDDILDSFKLQSELNPDIFEGEKHELKSDVRKKLLSIANNFLDFLGVEFFVHDVILTGSLANYNWSKYSDADLHILIDFTEAGHDVLLLKEFFDSKRVIWNSQHDVLVKGYPVEIYVQDIDEKHDSSGIYSVLKNKWLIAPEKHTVQIDKDKIKEKVKQWMDAIDYVEEHKDEPDILEKIEKIKDRLKKFRKAGLDAGGEYSYENLTFKYLRRNDYIKKLMDLKTELTDKMLSLSQ